LPDLRRSGTLSNKASWQSIVQDGIRKDGGMVGFAGSLSPEESDAIREYVIARANEDKAAGVD
jgi:hypothetical protein